MEEIKPKLSGIEAFFLIALALIADLINWIPVINVVTTFLTTGIFQFYFFIKKVKGAKWSLIGNLIEFVPFLSALPAITAGVVATILVDRAQTKLANKTSQLSPVKEDDLGYNYRELDEEIENPETSEDGGIKETDSENAGQLEKNTNEEPAEVPTFKKPVLNLNSEIKIPEPPELNQETRKTA